jgi:predicted ATPase
MQGWTIATTGDPIAGIALMHQGLTNWQAAGQILLHNYFYALLAEGYRLAGRTAEGIDLLVTGQALAARCDDQFYKAELYRLQGDLLLAQGAATSRVESCYHDALELARRRGEKILELRSVVSLARLWQQQGNVGAAHQMLTEIYNWFTEGFDTLDLQTAKLLLAELQAMRQ